MYIYISLYYIYIYIYIYIYNNNNKSNNTKLFFHNQMNKHYKFNEIAQKN